MFDDLMIIKQFGLIVYVESWGSSGKENKKITEDPTILLSKSNVICTTIISYNDMSLSKGNVTCTTIMSHYNTSIISYISWDFDIISNHMIHLKYIE